MLVSIFLPEYCCFFKKFRNLSALFVQYLFSRVSKRIRGCSPSKNLPANWFFYPFDQSWNITEISYIGNLKIDSPVFNYQLTGFRTHSWHRQVSPKERCFLCIKRDDKYQRHFYWNEGIDGFVKSPCFYLINVKKTMEIHY